MLKPDKILLATSISPELYSRTDRGMSTDYIVVVVRSWSAALKRAMRSRDEEGHVIMAVRVECYERTQTHITTMD
jgi:hypothetical protein